MHYIFILKLVLLRNYIIAWNITFFLKILLFLTKQLFEYYSCIFKVWIQFIILKCHKISWISFVKYYTRISVLSKKIYQNMIPPGKRNTITKLSLGLVVNSPIGFRTSDPISYRYSLPPWISRSWLISVRVLLANISKIVKRVSVLKEKTLYKYI